MLDTTLWYLRELGLPVSLKKTEPPRQIVEVLGVTLDIPRGVAYVAQSRIKRAIAHAEKAVTAGFWAIKDYQRFSGLCTWITLFDDSLSLHMDALYKLFGRRRRGRVPIGSITATVLNIFIDLVAQNKSLEFKLFNPLTSSVILTTDASGDKGMGGNWACHYWSRKYSPEEETMHITAKELLAVIECAEKWGASWNDKILLALIDNAGAAFDINKGRSKDNQVVELLHKLKRVEERFGFKTIALHLPRRFNVLADALSKNPTKTAKWLCGHSFLSL
jgi:hypothetical protein